MRLFIICKYLVFPFLLHKDFYVVVFFSFCFNHDNFYLFSPHYCVLLLSKGLIVLTVIVALTPFERTPAFPLPD